MMADAVQEVVLCYCISAVRDVPSYRRRPRAAEKRQTVDAPRWTRSAQCVTSGSLSAEVQAPPVGDVLS